MQPIILKKNNFLWIKKPTATDETDEEEYEGCDPPSNSEKWCNPEIYGVDHTMCKLSGCPQPMCGDVNDRGINSQVYSILHLFHVPGWNVWYWRNYLYWDLVSNACNLF